MSVMEKVQLMCQIRAQKTNTREPLLTCRKSAKSVSKSGSFIAPRPAYRLPVYWISDTRHRDGRWRELGSGFYVELQEPVVSMSRENLKERTSKSESTNAKHRGGATGSSNAIP